MNHGKNFWYSGMGTSVIVGLVMVLVVHDRVSASDFRILLLRSMLDTDSKDWCKGSCMVNSCTSPCYRGMTNHFSRGTLGSSLHQIAWYKRLLHYCCIFLSYCYSLIVHLAFARFYEFLINTWCSYIDSLVLFTNCCASIVFRQRLGMRLLKPVYSVIL